MAQHKIMRNIILIGIFALTAFFAAAQEQMAVPNSQKPTVNYKFDPSDRIQASFGLVRQTYFVGEPIVIPIVLSNHTRYPITVETNFNPSSMSKVMIIPSGHRPRKYNGPFISGYYAPSPFFLYPFEEINHDFIVWGDLKSPSDLAISTPGAYTIQLSVDINVPEAKVAGTIPVGAIEINVLPTPEKYRPLIEMLQKAKAFSPLQIGKTPIGWGENMEPLIKQFSPSVFTPYLAYSAATYFTAEYIKHPKDKAIADKALLYIQIAAKSTSPLKLDAYMDFLALLDKMQLTAAARQVAGEILTIMPRDRIGKIGMHPLILKYLINTGEYNRTKYWAILE